MTISGERTSLRLSSRKMSNYTPSFLHLRHNILQLTPEDSQTPREIQGDRRPHSPELREQSTCLTLQAVVPTSLLPSLPSPCPAEPWVQPCPSAHLLVPRGGAWAEHPG